MKKIKKLCEIKKKDYHQLEHEIIKIVQHPTFICPKCLRVANKEKHLCNSKAL